MKPRAAAVVLGLAVVIGACADALDGAADSAGAGGSGGGGSTSSAGVGGSTGHGGGGTGTVEVFGQESDASASAATGMGTPSTGSSGGSDGGDGGSGQGGEPTEEVCPEPSTYGAHALATVDDSNSYASPMLVRELTDDPSWNVGDPLPVRASELLNAYGQKIEDGDGLLGEDVDDALHVGVDARVDEHVDFQDRRLVRLAVSFTSYNAADVAVPDVTFVMDASPSMGGEPVERLQAVLRGATRTIAPETRSVAALTTKGGGTIVRDMEPWNGDVEPMAVAAADLDPEADFELTVLRAFDIARAQADDSATPGVVIVVTDGGSPLTSDLEDRIVLERDTWPPVRVVGVGVGPARTYVDQLLDTVTDESGGAYFYAPSKEAAEEELAARFTSLTQIAARGVKLRLDVPPTIQVVGVAGSAAPVGVDDAGRADGQNLGADSSMIFQLYMLAPAQIECQTVGLSLEWTDPTTGDTRFFPPDGTSHRDIPIWQRFDPQSQPGNGYARVEAILAAADALRGPTPERLGRAVEAMNAFLTERVPDDPVRALCGPLARFCDASDAAVDCLACKP